MTALPTIGAEAFPLHAESAAEAVLTGPRLEDVLALVERLAPADRARLREELRVRYDASGECEAVSPSQPHRLRQ
jgi:hypothetical protein